MKKIFCFCLLIISFLFVSSFSSFAATEPVGIVKVGFATPTIDGEINGADEGWLCGFEINKTVYGTAWSSHEDFKWSCLFYIAYDNNGLYFAADINDNFTVANGMALNIDGTDQYIDNVTILSTEQTGEFDDNGFGFDGDVFILALDPLNWFAKNGYDSQSDFTAWYNVAITSSGTEMVRTWSFRAENIGNVGEITGAKTAGTVTSGGWRFESYIPWTAIAEDCTAASGGEWTPTASELCTASQGDIYTDGFIDRANGNTWTSGDIMYIDRYLDEDTGGNATWQRYVTTAASVRGGFGSLSDAISLACYGIYFKMLPENSTEQPGRYGGGGNMETGSGSGTITDIPVDNVSLSTSPSTSSSSTGNSTSYSSSTATSGSAETFDYGIILAIGTAAVSSGLYFSLKKK